jgi:hypothetical protein
VPRRLGRGLDCRRLSSLQIGSRPMSPSIGLRRPLEGPKDQ